MVSRAFKRHGAYPDQPYHQHVQHNEPLPQVEVREFKGVHAPLPQIEETDDAQDVERLHDNQTHHEPQHLVAPGRGESEDGRRQNDAGFNRIAPGLDGDTKAVNLALNDVAVSNDLGIEQGNQEGAESSQRCRPRMHQGLTGRGELEREQHAHNQ